MKESYENVKEWRKNTKLRLIEAFGGKCGICNYDKSTNALEFHHLDPKEKEISFASKCIAWSRIVTEAKKCVMLCSNCHREIHAKDTILPEDIRRFDESYANYRLGKFCDSCPICGKTKPKSQKTCSKSCGAKIRYKIDWDKYDLKELYKITGSILGISKIIGNVSDTTVRNRMKKLGLL